MPHSSYLHTKLAGGHTGNHSTIFGGFTMICYIYHLLQTREFLGLTLLISVGISTSEVDCFHALWNETLLISFRASYASISDFILLKINLFAFMTFSLVKIYSLVFNNLLEPKRLDFASAAYLSVQLIINIGSPNSKVKLRGHFCKWLVPVKSEGRISKQEEVLFTTMSCRSDASSVLK
jgi:hypothetical protein